MSTSNFSRDDRYVGARFMAAVIAVAVVIVVAAFLALLVGVM